MANATPLFPQGWSPSRLSVVGLGKLGSCMAAAFASRGFDVIGVDVNTRTVDLVGRGEAPVVETGLADMLRDNRQRLRATTSHDEAIDQTDATFVIVPTPSDANGSFSTQYAAWAFQELGASLRKKAGKPHLFVMTSTVLPGACRDVLVPTLEKASGLKAGRDFGFCYSPEFIALGSVIRDFLNPDFTLVGEWDAPSGAALEAIYKRVLLNGAPCRRMSVENAELAKVSLNAYVTLKITFANMLAEACAKLPGGDVDAVTQALGFDRRIGSRYLRGGSSFGGPCFPRDNRALAHALGELGVPQDLPLTTDRLNETWIDRTTDRVAFLVPAGSTVTLLGLSYKPASPVLEASASLALAERLSSRGFRVVAHDPLVPTNAFTGHQRIVMQSDVRAALHKASLVLVANPDPAYEALREADFADCAPDVIVFDLWRLLRPHLAKSTKLRYIAHGVA